MSAPSVPSWIRQTLITLAEAARRLPPSRRGRPVSVSCVNRWIRHGLRTPHGKVRLEAFRLGRRWLTSIEALERFAAALTPDLNPGGNIYPKRPVPAIIETRPY